MRVQLLLYIFRAATVLSLILLPSLASAATFVTGDIVTDTRWTADGSPYVVNFQSYEYPPRSPEVAAGATLTIDQGVVVKFGEYRGLQVRGALRALGTREAPIIFTSLQDDSIAGDTNGDGATTEPAAEQWTHIEFWTGSQGVFDHSIVRYGGAFIPPIVMTGIANNGGELTIDHTVLTHNGYDGFGQYGGRTTITNSTISDQHVGISIEGGALTMSDTRVHHNSGIGINHSWEGALSITRSEIDHNGAGIVARSHGSIAVSDSSIHDNMFASTLIGIDNKSKIISYDENDEPYVSDPGITIDARNNWWGDASGPRDSSNNTAGLGDGVYGDVLYSPWLESDPFAPPDPCAVPGSCASSVLFLPGIEASRLYRPDYAGGTDKLWEPNIDSDVQDLYMNSDGTSVRPDIYTKDVIDEAYGTLNIYKSFLADLADWKNAGTIDDYRAAPYDWRVSLDDLLDYGREMPDGRLYYAGDLRATSTPYIIQELRRLAATSKTGKVTIVAHSNGGLIAKALLKRLQDARDPLLDKIDSIIMVAVPQAGTPMAIGALLHGYDQGLPFDSLPFVLTPETARTLAANMPSAYNLLPSASYFTYVDNPSVVFDDSDFLAEFRARYGSEIHDGAQLRNFVTDARRLASSSPSDLSYPSVGNAALLSRAETFHAAADAWTPPPGIVLHEIAGWGEDTLATIRYYEGKKTVCADLSASTCQYYTTVPTLLYSPKEVVEGDGTVVVPSALWTATSTGVAKYWMNLEDYNRWWLNGNIPRKHAGILEVPSLRTLIQNILTNATSTPLDFITTTQPVTDAVANKRLRFVLHSPLDLSATDNLGNMTNSATSTIPGSRWRRYGEVQVLTVPHGTPITINLDGVAAGSFTLDMQEIDGGNAIIASSTLSAIPSATSTQATLAFTDGTLQNVSPLLVDYDGDGVTDFSLQPAIGETTVFDSMPPEAAISFNPLSQRLQIIGIDNLSSTTVSTTATSSLITDEAGNTLEIIFKKYRKEKGELQLEIRALRYNGVSVGGIPKTALQYEWSVDRKGNIREFEQEVAVGSSNIEAYYNAKKNATRIEEERKGEKENRKTLPGLVVIVIRTEKGSIIIDY